MACNNMFYRVRFTASEVVVHSNLIMTCSRASCYNPKSAAPDTIAKATANIRISKHALLVAAPLGGDVV